MFAKLGTTTTIICTKAPNIKLPIKYLFSKMPILKIDCDDIEASHACSIGNLNENHIFYLMSRGISEDEARKLIVEGYLNPISSYFDEQNASEISEKIKGELWVLM